ncbi:MAG: ABC transporter permease [Deltaproteobacteria bacterium]|nr:ABC transporter permease [Deltaproteobacteria bacterium]
MLVLRRIMALIVKEFITIMRDPKSRFVVIGPPLIQFFVFGYAATFDVTRVRYAVLDEARTSESRQLLAAVDGSQHFRRVRNLTAERQIDEVINLQEARMVIHLGPDFSRRLLSGEQAPLQVIVDGRNSNVAAVALGYVSAIVQQYNAQRQTGFILKNSSVMGPRLVGRAWFNANLLSRWYIVAALGGTISMVVVMILTSLSVAREREFGTFDQLLVAPFTSGEILLAKAIPGITFGLLDSLFLAAAGVWWFAVPFRGTIAALIVTLFIFMLSIVGLGLFVSALSTTMQQALLGSFAFIMPAVILSGFTTPIENMPGWLQIATYANPMRYVVRVLRQIFLEGADLSLVGPQLWPLCIIAALILPPAAWLFRHRSQ